MFKLLLSSIAFTLISLAGNTQAQQPPTSTTPTPRSQSIAPTSTPLKATDLPLLNRVVGKFWQTDRAETESQIEIDSSDEKGKIKALVSIKTIAKVGKKFRSELTIDRVGKTSKIKYTVVSDGKNTWIYRPDLRQYAQITTSEFYREPSASIVGLSSVLFTSLDEGQRQGILADILSEDSQILSLGNLKALQTRQQQINDRNLSVYTIGDDLTDFKIRTSGFVDSKTAMFEQTEIKLEGGGKYTNIVEKIIKRNPQVTLTSKTFTFSPPKGVKKVKSLEIGPFKF